MDPKLRTLEIFRLFASTENVTETARLMGISQPAVSQILRDLEAQIGLSLFTRVGNRLQVSAEGREILPDVERLIHQMSHLRTRVDDLRNEKGGHLSIASVPTMIEAIIPRAIAAFRKDRPHVQLKVGSFTAADVFRQVRLEQADIGLTFLPINDTGVLIEPLLKTAMVCMLLPDHPLAKKKTLTPDDLKDQTIIAQGPETPPGYVLRNFLESSGLSNMTYLQVNQAGVAQPLAAHGLGIALAHPLGLSPSAALVAVPFSPKVELTLAVLRPKFATPSRIVSRFVSLVRAELTVHAQYQQSRGLFCQMVA